MMAGGIAGLSAEQFIAITGMMALLAFGISLVVSLVLKLSMTKMLLTICYSVLLTLIFPLLMLSVRITARQKSIQKDLPDVLDLVTVSVEAGLSFDGALAKMSEKMNGTLVEEFGRVLQEMRMGVTRRDALKGMSSRCGNKDLSLFVSALVQADQLGVSIGSILRVQAAGIRKNRQMQIEEIAAKAPIKMLFPLVTCIFPSLFIVVLGPAMLKVATQLFK
jgi:tight adherence protein C